MNLLMDGRLYLAPLEEVHNALDVGTGTGRYFEYVELRNR